MDDPTARLRSHERTEYIIQCFDSGTMWDDYGIRDDVVIRTLTLSSVVLPLAEICMYSRSLPASCGQTSMNCCLPISSTRSSKGLSRIILLLGFRSTSKTAIQHAGQKKLFRILIGGIHIHMVSFSSLNLNLYLGSQLYHLMPGCVDSQKAESTSNGPVMTPRL